MPEVQSTADLSDLLRRVKEATGGDQEIDLDLWCATADRHQLTITQAPFTSSIDAALALVDRILPGAWFRLGSGYAPWAELPNPRCRGEFVRGHAKTPALAILAALLTALTTERDVG